MYYRQKSRNRQRLCDNFI